MTRPDLAEVRRAYERGRVGHGLRAAALVVPMVAISFAGCGRPSLAIAVGAVLAVAVVALRWHGGVAGRAVLPGLCAGTAALVLALVVCRAVERAGVRGELAMLACAAAGFACGAVIVRAARDHAEPWRFAVVAGALGALGSALGCLSAGFGGVAAMVLGLVAIVPIGLRTVTRAT